MDSIGRRWGAAKDGGSSPEDSMLVDALQSSGDLLSSHHHSLQALTVHCSFAAAGQGDHDNESVKVEFFDDILTFFSFLKNYVVGPS